MQNSQLIVGRAIKSENQIVERFGTLSYKIITNLEEMDDELIRTLAPDNYRIIDKNFSRVIEKSLDGAQVQYIVVNNSLEQPIALIYLVSCHADLPIFKFVSTKSFPNFRYAICGNPIITGNCGISMPQKNLRDKLLPQLLEILKQALKKLKVSAVILRDMEAPKQIFTGSGFFHIPSEPAVGVERVDRWNNFSEYLADMEGKYRQKVTSSRKRLEKQGIKIHVERNINNINDRLYELYISVARSAPPSSGKISLQNIPVVGQFDLW